MGASISCPVDSGAIVTHGTGEDEDLVCLTGGFEFKKGLCDWLTDVAGADDGKILEAGHGLLMMMLGRVLD
jgi:hypothetical protein